MTEEKLRIVTALLSNCKHWMPTFSGVESVCEFLEKPVPDEVDEVSMVKLGHEAMAVVANQLADKVLEVAAGD